ncbi:glycerophosphodiester phosphodiesterase domain-containing 5-like isoform X1 [Labeo rohita]|uniref:Glycerophosphodiester phosphodiesterase domain-containing 5-like isoform X1 n=1 Tax=Labeo rohita TaxID=84645 RepID=A0A498NUL4_LABRO|nr:glycerophosphodiester phosphodiesterase domain-containing protein 5 isoform X1 [Labeo rohita]XP_050990931.1 glycerophosphodiester phosphodiesterase domain-containing protein 5 isoform X1 [Labeo rohita]RXN35289.1 glycerophosphodiester phosphodiesterase domain-containing 5-like isoform X1 [Labeo rohita]
MGRSPVSLSRLKLGKLKVVRRQLLQRYEHQPFVSCLAGLYGCQWRRYQRAKAQPGECCCSRLECSSFALLIVTFVLTLIFLYFWSEAQNDYNDFDWFNFGNLGFWFPWSVVLLVVAAALFTYIALLLVLAVCLLSEGQRLYLHWSHKIGILVTLTFSISATAVLSDLWSKEWTTLLLSFQVTAPFLHVGGVSLMTLLSWPIALHFFRMNKRVRQVALLGLFLAVLFALYLVPLGMYSPCIKEEGTLGPAPTLIGHRGAPMLAPENTQMSFEKAVEAGGEGLETDVTISYDGIPFLMHDSTLRRTTNVHEVFPNRTDTLAAMFTWAELEMLSAGSWFLQRDPFGTASSLDEDEKVQIQNQTIPTLKEFLNLAAQHEKMVIFDLRRPPREHPYRDTWISRTLEVIHNESSINSSQVLWLPADQRSLVQEMDPKLQQTSGDHASIEELQDKHIVRLNLHYSYMSQEQIRKYASVNISTNLYVISQPWLYSLAWCAGVHSVTTNALHVLKKLQRPLFLMTPDEYSLMWILTDIISAFIITAIFIFHWWRERGLPFWSGSRQVNENGPYSKFRTEASEVHGIRWNPLFFDGLSLPRDPEFPLHVPPVHGYPVPI